MKKVKRYLPDEQEERNDAWPPEGTEVLPDKHFSDKNNFFSATICFYDVVYKNIMAA